MSGTQAVPLSVSILELRPVHAAFIAYKPEGEPGGMHDEIHDCFVRIQDWVRGFGLDPLALLHVGIPILGDGRLLRYECCVEVPAEVQSGLGEIGVQELPGGRYAVVTIDKDPAIIGPSIGRFYQAYAPQNQIEIDGTRPTYEIYYETTMEYCVPIR